MTEISTLLRNYAGNPDGYARALIRELDEDWPQIIKVDVFNSLKKLANEGIGNAIARKWFLEHNLKGDLMVGFAASGWPFEQAFSEGLK